MATSNSTNFSINRMDIVQRALRRVNVLAEGHVPSGEMESDAVFNLNLLIKEWMNYGYNLWTYTEQYVFLSKGVAKYSLAGARSCYEADYIKTKVRVAALSGATTFEVDSTSGMAVGDQIGVLLDSNLLHWTTIASVVDSDTLTLTVGLGGAAAVGRRVHTYTTSVDNPLRVQEARRVSMGGEQVPVDVQTRSEYNETTNKETTGTLVSLFLDRQRDTKDIFIWPVPADETETLLLTVQRKLQDFDAATDNPDFPIEWGNAIIWNLAETLAHEYNVDSEMLKRIHFQATKSHNLAMNFFDREDQSLFFQPQKG